jgi:pyridoxal phosphate enzyme (YggS family)
MIQSVDSFRLLATINSEALKAGRVIDCLLQLHIAAEETKYGFSFQDLQENIVAENVLDHKNVRICGVMGMATFTSDTSQISREFSYLRECFEWLKHSCFNSVAYFKEISMGMSGDYETAIKEGSTMVRIGSIIFGNRNIK